MSLLKPSHHQQHHPQIIHLPATTILLSILLLLSPIKVIITTASSTNFGTRHSYSLTTFDPSGNLDQVVRAIRASALGVPIVALCIDGVGDDRCTITSDTAAESQSSSLSQSIPKSGGIYLAIPLHTPSPLLHTSNNNNILQLTSTRILLHTGITSDGRTLSNMALSLSLDYKYLYGQEIPISDLLSGLSEKMVEMTMKAGCRPFGCALLICELNESGRNEMYRVDPGGAVVALSVDGAVCSTVEEDKEVKRRKRSVTFLGNWNGKKESILRQQLILEEFGNIEDIRQRLVEAARQCDIQLEDEDRGRGYDLEGNRTPVLFASFDCERGLVIERITS